MRWWAWLRFVPLIALVALWARDLWYGYTRIGLFRVIGFDWSLYFAQASAFLAGQAKTMYDLAVLQRYQQVLTAYTRLPGAPLIPGPVPYPPLFTWVFTPFALLPPPVGFALWTGLSVLVGLHLARRVAACFPPGERLWAVVVLLTAFPVVNTLMVGQPMLLLAGAVAEGYLCLRAGRDFRAGLWFACILLKPQYGLLLAALFLLKRRRAAVAAGALGVAVVVAGSLLVAGVPAFLAYLTSVVDLAHGFRGSGILQARLMANWRSLVLLAFPAISDRRGEFLTLAASAATVLALIPAWQGRWDPRGTTFPARFTLLLLATLLVSYHNFAYGAVLLALPLAEVLGERRTGWPARLALVALLFLPSIFVFATTLAFAGLGPQLGGLFALLLVLCFAALLRELWVRGGADGTRAAIPESMDQSASPAEPRTLVAPVVEG